MEIIYGKQLSGQEQKTVMDISINCGITFNIARLLFYREINTVEKAKEFLSPGKDKFYNPFDFKLMQDAVDRIEKAKLCSEKVVIFGDYDVDGICAVATLKGALKIYGIDAEVFVPEREEGYGINIEKFKNTKDGRKVDLLITVDCGISEYEKIEIIKNSGTDVIVTDHHEPPAVLPECIVLDPKINDSGYKFDGLCGAGVAFKLSQALIGEKAYQFLDYVALATVADNMDLISENRSIVVEGLKIFNNNIRLPFKYLINENGKKITAQTFAFSIGPRVNAGGRMGDALSALKLFTSEDEKEIFDLTVKLNFYNTSRQNECDNIYREAKQVIIDKKLYKNPVILVEKDSWSTGFIGIVASKLVEEYSRPVIVFAGDGENFKGSARSVDGFNILNVITECSEFLTNFGGHSQAAGVSVKQCDFERFSDKFISIVKDKYARFEAKASIAVDWKVDKPFDTKFVRELDLLEPFGIGNRKPLFAVEVDGVELKPLKLGSPHFSFKHEYLEILHFNGEKEVETLSYPNKKTVIFELNRSVFKGKESIKGYLKNVIYNYDDFSVFLVEILKNELKKTLLGQNKDVSFVQYDKDLVKDGYGDLYLISNPENIEKYPALKNLKKTIFTAEGLNGKNALIVSPKEIPLGYSRVIYLDNPLSILDSELQTLVVKDLSGKGFLDKVSTDRTDFAESFNYIMSMEGEDYYSARKKMFSLNSEYNPYQTAFAFEVFSELGFFENKNGVLRRNYNTKSVLTNSKLYDKILNIKQG